MKICIDIQSAIAQRAGVGRYTRSLVEHLPTGIESDEVVLFSFDFSRKGSLLNPRGLSSKTIRWCPGRIAQKCWKTFGLPPFNWFSGNADVFHFPNFIIPPVSKGKKIVTIHDASFMRFPEFAEERNLSYLNSQINRTIEQADAIITVSRFSADELAATTRADPAKIFPIYPGVDDHPDSVAAQNKKNTEDNRNFLKATGITKPFLLNVGTIEPRKNTAFLFDVFEKMNQFDGLLVIAGMKGWKYEPFFEKMRASQRKENIIYLDYVNTAQLNVLYTKAELFMFPSFYEGFGFPPLEAMSRGTPVLASDKGSLPEVLGNGARIMKSYDADEWAVAAMEILENKSARELLAQSGRKKAMEYTWQKTATATWQVYRQAGK